MNTEQPAERGPRWVLIRAPVRRLWARSALWLLALVLVAGAVNMPLALWCARHNRQAGYALPVRIREGVPEETSWPSRTPHAEPWPTPNSWDEGRIRLGWWRIEARRTERNEGRFAAQVDLYGWPLPCFEIAQFWWPWNDPAWAMGQTGFIRLRWAGVLLNPLLAAGAAFGLVGVPIIVGRLAVWRTRLVLGHCPICGYDLRGNFGGGCPECGWNRGPGE